MSLFNTEAGECQKTPTAGSQGDWQSLRRTAQRKPSAGRPTFCSRADLAPDARYQSICNCQTPKPVCVHTQRLRTLCMTAFFTDVCHTSKKEENKLPHLEPRIQRVKDSKPPGFKDSRIQALQDSKVQAFKDSRAHRWKDSAINVWAFVPRQPHQTFPNSSFGSPQSKAYEDTCSKALERKHKSGKF